MLSIYRQLLRKVGKNYKSCKTRHLDALRSDTTELHLEAKLKMLKHRRREHTLLHIFQISRSSAFKCWKRRTCINTRNDKKKLMIVKKPNSTKFQNSITYLGPKHCNSLPLELQQSDSHLLFKIRLHSHLSK